ncbi:MAG: hypothetical protein Q9170_006593 [Blastenia crenularia]
MASGCHVSSPDDSTARAPTGPMYCLSSIAMNLITAASAMKALPSGALDAPKTSDNMIIQAASPSMHPEDPSISVSDIPKARSRRRSSQSKRSYQLAHPPPSAKNRQRLRIRPRTLLQLQRLSETSRPLPVMDVLPSILFAPRLARRIPHIFQGKQGLGMDDLIFVRSQTQDSAILSQDRHSEDFDETTSSDREVIAAICQSSPTTSNVQYRTEIHFTQGSTWAATALRSGAYEFVSHLHGETWSIARWVPKRDDNTEDNTDTQRFKFSLIDTNTRRHPVIANMSKRSIDVYDWYTVPSNWQDPSHIGDNGSVDSATLEESPRVGADQSGESLKMVMETDDHLRTIIAVTGVWVAFCEGWSPNFKYDTKQVIANGVSELANRRRSNTPRPMSQITERPHYHQTLTPIKEIRYRPGILHTSSLSSVPSTSSLASPIISPRRTFSSFVPGTSEHQARASTYFDGDRQSNPVVWDIDSDGEDGVIKSIPNANTIPGALSGSLHEVIDGGKNLGHSSEAPFTKFHARKESGQDLVSETTLVEEIVKRPSRLRRVLGHLRRSKTTHRSR